MFDVAVIGAGPSGAVTAWQLGKNWKVALIEKDEFAGKNNVCAGGIAIHTAKRVGLPDSIVEKSTKYNIVKDNEKIVSKSKSDVLTVQRKKFDNFLAKKAAKVCDYYPSTRIDSVEKNNETWILKSGKKKFETKIIVFADGPVSKLRKELNIGFQVTKDNSYGAIIRDFKVKNTGENLIFVFDEKVTPFGYGWLFPKKDQVNVGLDFLSTNNWNAKKGLDYLIKQYFPELKNKKPFNEQGAIIPAKIAKKLYDEKGLIVVGDAAGFVNPLTGDGMNPGIDGSFIASEVIHNALTKKDITLIKKFDEEIKKTNWYWQYRAEAFYFPLFKVHPKIFNKFVKRVFTPGFFSFLIPITVRLLKR